MNGLDQAVKVLTKGVDATSFVQTAAVAAAPTKKVKVEDQNHGNRFWLIAKAIKDMITTHQEEKAFNQDQYNQCQKTVLEGSSQAAAKSALIDQLKGKIASAKAEKDKRETEKKDAETEKKDTETELQSAQDAWEASNAARAQEVTDLETLQEHVGKAITFLQDSDSGRDAFGQAIAVLQMVLGEIVKETDTLIKTKDSEEASFVDRKAEMYKLIGTLEKTIAELARDINLLGQKLTRLDAKLKETEAQEPLPVDECKKFMKDFQGFQDALNTKMSDLTKAKAQLEGWENQSTE
jgi:chromosome segregation ATPase